MDSQSKRYAIMGELKAAYETNGFVTEDEVLACFTTHDLTLSEIDSITELLLVQNILIRTGEDYSDDDDLDRTQTNYEEVYAEVLRISPGLRIVVDFISSIRPPQYREWKVLIPQAQNNNRFAKYRLFEMYLRVVLKIALNTYKSDGYELEDLFQEGATGLMRAIQSYDSTKHGSFVHYFPNWVWQRITRAIADKSRLIRLPVHIHTSIGEELFEFIPIDNFLVEDEEDGFVEYIFEEEEGICIVESAMQNNLREQIELVVSKLTPREAAVINMRYGLDDGQIKTLEAIGNEFNVTRERIRQIENKALRKLRHPSRIKYIKDFIVKRNLTIDENKT